MPPLLTEWQERKRDEFRAFADTKVAPRAAEWDRAQKLPDAALSDLAQSGYLGCLIPREHGGEEWGAVTFGLLNEAFGRTSSALTGVLTVQAMVAMTLLKWGTEEQKRAWLPSFAKGEHLGAFALTEPGAGSSLRSLATTFRENHQAGYVLNGAKKWISCGQFADVFLVFGMLGKQSMACLVPRQTPGLRVEPISDLMGFRAAGLAQLEFDNVAVPSANVVGRPGFALSHVVPVGLHYGRISTACSALGLLRGCFEESIMYGATRKIGEKRVGDFGLVRGLITRMGADLEAAQLLCHRACQADDEHLPEVFERTLIAKYFASTSAVRAASDAVQIFGAAGCHESSPVSRYYRDAKILEIIEGTTQIHEDILGKMFVGQANKLRHDTDA